MEKAKQLAAGLDDRDFKPTEGWLGRWKQRNNIIFRRCHGEKKDTDAESGEDWIRDALPIILLRGAVFAMSPKDCSEGDDKEEMAVKISWVRSAESVSRECNVLRLMEERGGVPGVERCVSQSVYPGDARRAMIALTPVISGDGEDGPVLSPFDLEEGGKLQIRAATDIARTTVRMLAAGVATVDVQALISRDTGRQRRHDGSSRPVVSAVPPGHGDGS